MQTAITIRGARTHNLKQIDCSFPHGRLTVITGLSGSGKSSLAFDTLYAEGRRRYVESLSTYIRQFLERMERPDVDEIDGLQPAIALEQVNSVRSARATVGTSTEIYDYLRLLFAKLGELVCPRCDRPMRAATPQTALDALRELPAGTRLLVLGPVDFVGERIDDALRTELVRAGWHRLWDGRTLIDLEAGERPADPHAELAIVIDRVAYKPDAAARLREALETAFRAGRGRARVTLADDGRTFTFAADLRCEGCGETFEPPEPHLFSFHSPLGACPACQGFGRTVELDLDKIIPNRSLSIDDGAIAPWNSIGNLEMYDYLRRETTPDQIPRRKAIADFSPQQWRNLLEGVGNFCGIRGYFDWLESKKYKVQARVMLARYRAFRTCAACGGARLRPEALRVRLRGRTIAQWTAMPVRDLKPFLDALELTPLEARIAGRVLDALRARVACLDDIGLGYLTLDRATRTLSGGEAQRINLAAALGSALTETLYVLDEPTVGLHPRDTDRLIRILHALRDRGNTVVVVEHDLDVIRAADRILELGPGAGEAGGRVIFEGSPADLLPGRSSGRRVPVPETPTVRHVRGYHAPPHPSRGRAARGWLTIVGARGHNLKNLTVRIPLGVLACVSGVSGSGKTTLVRDTLCAHYRRLREVAPVEAEPCDRIEGLEQIEELHWVDQAPPAAGSRSNPVTFVKAYEPIRRLLAESREARALGLTARDFSFNVDGGRCPVCRGTGRQTIDLHFMADVEVVCEACDGRRFQPRVLELRWNGRNIDDILAMTADEAAVFFQDAPAVVRALRPLRDVGLGYVRLGQPTSTLSGGEAQRLKLAAHLATLRARRPDRVLLVFDEPTTGLHAEDVARLVGIFQHLVERGCSLLVIEHNQDVLAAADWIIDLGPEGGDEGGRVVAQGPPEAIMAEPASWTGRWLRHRFEAHTAAAQPAAFGR